MAAADVITTSARAKTGRHQDLEYQRSLSKGRMKESR
jgi:hypothetical protein